MAELLTQRQVDPGRQTESGRPLDARAISQLQPRPARSNRMPAIQQRFYVAANEEPTVRTRVERSHVTGQYSVVVEIDGLRPGARAFPGPIEGKEFRRGAGSTLVASAALAANQDLVSGHCPDHLAFAPAPTDFVRARKSIEPGAPNVKRPTTVFPPENRRVFRDTSYPYSTVGQVVTPNGQGSGVMIGPRHLLTVSHVIDWNVPAPNACNWVKFMPSFFDGESAVFGHAYATRVYWFNKDNGDNAISNIEEQYDYVVCVLDSRIGERTGWMGARGYHDAWDGMSVWAHMGYPADLNGGNRPTWQSGFPLDGSDTEPDEHETMTHQADVYPGQSGGPIYGWWAGETFPRAVAVQSWETAAQNGGSGGGDLQHLVVSARTDFP